MRPAALALRVDAWQRRHALGGLPVAVVKKFGEDRASGLAAMVAYYAFFALFPLLLALVSILGFVLDGDPSLQDDVVDTALGRIPVIGVQLRDEIHPLRGSGIALAIGVDAIVEHGAVAVASLAINGAVFMAVFGLLTPGERHVRALLPGVALAAAGWLALQALGGWYVDRVVADASATYGTFSLVIGLLSWFWLGTLLVLLAAELNVVLVWRLWPRSLTGEPEPADRRAMRRLAESARRARGEEIAVAFGDEPESATTQQSP